MRFTVVWEPTALEDLAALWNEASNRRAVSDAANRIDRELRLDAPDSGRDFFGDRYLVIEPLAVVFSVSEDDLTVRVLQVIVVGN